MKHKEFCKKDPVDWKVKSDSQVRRQEQNEHCEKVKLDASRLVASGSKVKEDVFKVLEACQTLGIKDEEEKCALKTGAKGGKLSKLVKSKEQVEGGEEVGPALEVDMKKKKSDSKEGKQKQEEVLCGGFKSGLATSGAVREEALKVAQSDQGSKGKEERKVKKTRGGKLSKLVESEGKGGS